MGQRYTLLLFLILSCFFQSQAQTDTEFWFTAPEVSFGHAGETPIVFRVSTGDTAATVLIEQPARGNVYYNVTIPANSTRTIDLSDSVNVVETKPADTVLDYGFHISSDNPITVYYEVNATSNNNNPEIFALKGTSGLGSEFYTPFQTLWDNGSYTPQPYSSIELVATEDSTRILVSPECPVVGHPSGNSFFVYLDRGESYSVADTDPQNTVNNLSGSIVSSDKPIAVTVKDGSVSASSGGCKDIMGDQIVPVDIVGKEYIVNRGALDPPDEQVFIVATQNGTDVSIGGAYETTLNAGGTYSYEITNALTYITATSPVYVLHASGFGCEHGEALLPPLNCAGSEQVAFNRSTTEFFGMNLLVQNGAQGDFAIDGDTTLIDSADFSPVPGTGGQWVGAQLNFDTSVIQLDSAYLITNSTSIFSMGIINGGATSGCRFGYFSEYVSETFVDAGTDITACANTDISLNGSISGGTNTGKWTTNGSGTFDDDTDLSTSYFPSPADTNSGSIELYLTSTGICFPETDTLVLDFTPAPRVVAGPDQTLCENNADVSLNGYVSNVAVGGAWTGGNGAFSPNNTDLNATYTPTQAELDSGSLKLKLTSIGNGGCNPVADSLLISFTEEPIVDAGSDDTVCADPSTVSLNGSVSGATTTGGWSGGNGTFNPDTTDLNASYTPTQSEINAGTVTLTLTSTNHGNCTPVSDNVTIVITDAPQVDAGSDQSVCANQDVSLSGSVTGGSSTGQWTTTGTGAFTPDDSTLSATYAPSNGDTSNGGVTLFLTSTNNGDCDPQKDTMQVTFTAAPKVEAGPDTTLCENNPSLDLSGSIWSGASSGVWSTNGSGTFSNSSDLNATYNPSNGDITSGSVFLELTTTDHGSCAPVSDSLLMSFSNAPLVDAGPNDTVCSNDPYVSLNGSVSNASAGVWSGGAGSFSPSSSSLNATYTPTQTEINAGNVTLTLESTGNGNCLPESDDMKIVFTPEPQVDAGSDISACANTDISLNGSVSGGSSTGQWSTSGTGAFDPSATDLNAVYLPSNGDTLSGNVKLFLTSTNNGDCNAVEDTLDITFTSAPRVEAGPDQSLCKNDPVAQLNGTVSVGSNSGVWSTSGSGSFSNSTDLNANYSPSNADTASGGVTLYLTSTNNGNCNPEEDSLTLSYTPGPTVDAGSDITTCVNDLDVQLNGSVSGGTTTGQWSTSGSGSFSNSSDLNATYQASSSDSANGGVTLYLASTNNGNCIQVVDSLLLNIFPGGTASAGNDTNVCANNADIPLSGVVSGAASGGQWSTTGSGTFSPSDSALNTTYIPSDADTSNGIVELYLTANSCDLDTDTLQVSIGPAPKVEAGMDILTCVDSLDLGLSGNVWGGSSTGQWSTSGSGTFAPSISDLNATYQASSSDSINGGVELILSSTNNGKCTPVRDTLDVAISPAGFVDAGNDTSVCANTGQVPLDGNVSGGATKAQWSTSGSGTFLPSDTVTDPSYLPSDADTASGNVDLIIEAVNSCNEAKDTMNLVISPAPKAFPGNDTVLCKNSGDLDLNGSVNFAGGGSWSTSGSGTFSPSANVLSTTYQPSSADLNQGQVVLYLTTTNNGDCNPEMDSMIVDYTSAPLVNAGSDMAVCIDANSVQLNGSVSGGATTGSWSTVGGTGGTFSPNSTTLNAEYFISSGDTAAGFVDLVLASTNNGDCNAERDTLRLTFTNTPFVDAGNNKGVCEDDLTAQLNGTVTGGTNTGEWTTLGSGAFADSSDLQSTYTFSSVDSTNGSVDLVLTSTNNGSCQVGKDTVQLTVSSLPTANAGSDQVVCPGSPAGLSGSISNAVGGVWSTTGSGTFSPNDSTLTASYQPASSDSVAGGVGLVLKTFGSGGCPSVEDTMDLSIEVPLDADFNYSTPCVGNQVQFSDNTSVSAGSIANYEWKIEGNSFFSNGVNYTFSNAGPHAVTLIATSSLGCSDSIVKTIDVKPLPSVGFNTSFTCPGDPVQFTDTSTIASGNLNAWNWKFGDGDSGSGTPVAHVFDSSKTYQVKLTVTSDIGCTDSVTQPVSVSIDSFIDINYEAQCPPTNIAFSDTMTASAGSVTNWEWSFGDGNTSIQDGPVHSYSGAGSYVVDLIVSTDQGCEDTVSQAIQVSGEMTVDFSNGPTCVGNPVNFQDQTNVPGGTVNNREWTIDGSTFNSMNPSYTFGSEGAYDVKLVVTTDYGCVDSLTRTLNLDPVPEVNIFVQNDCSGDSVRFRDSTLLSSGTVASYTWLFGDGDTSYAENPVHLYDQEGYYNVHLKVASAEGCVDSSSKEVRSKPDPRAGFGYDTSNGAKVGQTIFFSDSSQYASLWQWDFGDESLLSYGREVEHIFAEEGQYTVMQVVQDELGCTDTAFAQLDIHPAITVVPPAVPSGFSPNGDNNNDQLYVRGGPFKKLTFQVYDQWGNQIFSTEDASRGWDGTRGGQKAQLGEYVYTLKAVTEDGKEYKRSGDITLIR